MYSSRTTACVIFFFWYNREGSPPNRYNEEDVMTEQISQWRQELIKGNIEKIFAVFQALARQKEVHIIPSIEISIEDVVAMGKSMEFLSDRNQKRIGGNPLLHAAGARIRRVFHDLGNRQDSIQSVDISRVAFCVFGVSLCNLFLGEVANKHIRLSGDEQYLGFIAEEMRRHGDIFSEFYWKRPEYPVRLAAGMNGRIMNCAPGGARLANKVFPVPRLIPRRGNPREPLAAGIGRGKFYNGDILNKIIFLRKSSFRRAYLF